MKGILSYPGKTSLASLKKALSYIYYFPAGIIDKLKLNRLEKNPV
jgi:hypothetical protein